ncbi:MAG: FAD-dependent oxidoreductase, partial [Planctomycetota bacterium]|nr:FAD-dependent oxidoreductase [Planctomycetota bacterium]
MFFPRRDFLKTLAWLFGASQVSGCATSQTAATGATTRGPSASPPAPLASPRGVAAAPLTPGKFDLIVVGGGFSGTAAAISAARNGVKVALVHDRSMLGGNSSSEVRLYPEGNDAYQPWIRESGIHEEVHLEDRVRNHVRYREGLTNCHWDLVLYEWCVREPNLTLFLNTYMHEVRMASPKRIGAIRGVQLGTEKVFELTAPLFVDASGDGMLGYRAGADFRWGREGRDEYGEPLAPEKA